MDIPSWLQSTLWLTPLTALNSEKDKVYIVHHILSHGGLREIQWLFSQYSKEEIQSVFATHPYKEYAKPRYVFIRDIVLGITTHEEHEDWYVANTPRNIRS